MTTETNIAKLRIGHAVITIKSDALQFFVTGCRDSSIVITAAPACEVQRPNESRAGMRQRTGIAKIRVEVENQTTLPCSHCCKTALAQTAEPADTDLCNCNLCQALRPQAAATPQCCMQRR